MSKTLGTTTVSAASLAVTSMMGSASIQLQSQTAGSATLQGRLLQHGVMQGQLATLLPNPKVQGQVQAQGQGENQQEAISAIVQSLMRAETQFEQKKLEDSQRKIPSSPSLVSPGSSTNPQLPTAPVPQASLTQARAGQTRVSLAGLLSSTPQQMVTVSSLSSPMVAVTGVSQLAAQLARPVAASSLPTYSQALREQQTSPRKRADALVSPSPQVLPSPSEGGAAALSALLADTPAADKPLPPGAQGVSNTNSNALLERLVSQSHHSSSVQASQGSNLIPTAGQLPSVHPNHSNGSSEEITLQSLLSNPGKTPSQSPSKHSPLLQQLQQPVRMYQPGITSPRHPPASPRSSVTSPRSLSSPRLALPPSPRPPSALQQQLMQPPAPRYPQPVTANHSILSAALSSNIASSGARSSQHLLQGLVQVTQSGQVVNVSLADHTATTPATSIANGHLMVQGVQGGFQLLNQVGGHGQQLQLVQQAGNGGGVQLVNSVGGQSGQLQLVSQGQLSISATGQVTSQPQFQVIHPGQQLQIVQNQPVGGQAVSFAVNGVTQNVRTATTMAKLVSSPNGGGPTTVVLQQGTSGNILLPQQQQFAIKQGGQVMVRQQQVVQGQVAGTAQVMVRPGHQQQVQLQQPFQVVQVPAGQMGNHNQIIQIGRSMAVNNLVSVNKGQVVGSPSPQGPPTPGLALSPALSVTSPQSGSLPPDSPLVVQMEGTHPHFLQQPQIINNINKPALNNQTHLKMRQQRKQSLK